MLGGGGGGTRTGYGRLLDGIWQSVRKVKMLKESPVRTTRQGRVCTVQIRYDMMS